ncbi:hypothetical protein GOODEAATRI_002008 [Goodea atripinnis]|uniref:Uncharacterized protein n=1 Tax=Goodea atripinnis TaxID=208336 RepID=A0ABV0MEA0_9TELE
MFHKLSVTELCAALALLAQWPEALQGEAMLRNTELHCQTALEKLLYVAQTLAVVLRLWINLEQKQRDVNADARRTEPLHAAGELLLAMRLFVNLEALKCLLFFNTHSNSFCVHGARRSWRLNTNQAVGK